MENCTDEELEQLLAPTKRFIRILVWVLGAIIVLMGWGPGVDFY